MKAKDERNYEQILTCSDLHGPFLDKRAWSVFLQVAASRKWDRVIVNGDIWDFAMLSVRSRSGLTIPRTTGRSKKSWRW